MTTEQALRTAIGHLEHMSAWLGRQNTGYSFEGLGEDMPAMRQALAAIEAGWRCTTCGLIVDLSYAAAFPPRAAEKPQERP